MSLPGSGPTHTRMASDIWSVADLLRDAEKAHDGVAVGSYPFFRDGRTGANFVVRSADAALVDRCIADLVGALEATGRVVTPEGI